MAAAHSVSGFGRAAGPGLAGDLIARLGEKMRRLLRPNWLLFRSNETADELTVARQGPVEIRQTLAGWSLETRVKGEPDRARATALRRLGNDVNGGNRSRARLRVVRPLVQTEESMGRWRLRVALPGVDSDFVAAAGRNGRVRLRAYDSETLAVIRVLGRPTPLAIQHAETAIRHAIAPTTGDHRHAAASGLRDRVHGAVLYGGQWIDADRQAAIRVQCAADRRQRTFQPVERGNLRHEHQAGAFGFQPFMRAKMSHLRRAGSQQRTHQVGPSPPSTIMCPSSSIAPRLSSRAAHGSGGCSGRLGGARRGAATARACVSMGDGSRQMQSADRNSRGS